jgi:ABC-type cobalamin/Fe3+-siderophores transport system ATPase subunit
MDLEHLQWDDLEHDIVLVGPNGSGKSRTLRNLCHARVNAGKHVIAISNTQYSRLPDYKRENYEHVRVNPGMTNFILKSLIVSALESKSRSYSSMRDVLTFTGYEPVLEVKVSIGNIAKFSPRVIVQALEDLEVKPEEKHEVRYVAESLHQVAGLHTFHLDDIFSFFSESEVVALLLKHQSIINRGMRALKGKISVSFGLVRTDGRRIPVHKASSGELTLITLAMFILTNSDKLECVFIDEPENSLHPQWQSNFLSFISTIARREYIKFLVASHSPVLLTGALTSERHVKVIRCRPDGLDQLSYFTKETDDSVEELLWEAFDVITPASQFVAKQVSDLLWRVQEGEITKNNAIQRISSFIEKSISRNQEEFLQASIKLVEATAQSAVDVRDD